MAKNPWQERLQRLADDHRKDGMPREARDLEHGIPHVTDRATFRAVVAAVCWWDDGDLDHACAEMGAP